MTCCCTVHTTFCPVFSSLEVIVVCSLQYMTDRQHHTSQDLPQEQKPPMGLYSEKTRKKKKMHKVSSCSDALPSFLLDSSPRQPVSAFICCRSSPPRSVPKMNLAWSLNMSMDSSHMENQGYNLVVRTRHNTTPLMKLGRQVFGRALEGSQQKLH